MKDMEELLIAIGSAVLVAAMLVDKELPDLIEKAAKKSNLNAEYGRNRRKEK